MSKYTKHLFQVRCERIFHKLADEIAYAIHPSAGFPAAYTLESTYVGLYDDDDNYYFVITLISNSGCGFTGAILRDLYSFVGDFIDYIDNNEIHITIQ